MLTTPALCLICALLGIIAGATFVSLDMLLPPIMRAYRKRQRINSARRLAAIAFAPHYRGHSIPISR